MRYPSLIAIQALLATVTSAQHVPEPDDAAVLALACEAPFKLDNPGVATPAFINGNDHMGWSMALGHWDGDGILDLAAGGIKHVGSGGTTRVFVFRGLPDGTFDSAPDVILRGHPSMDQFGFDVEFMPHPTAATHDLLVVGAPNYPNTSGGADRWGRVYLFDGEVLPSGVELTAESCASVALESQIHGARFGDVVRVVDDLDGLAGPDLAIGAPGSLDSDGGSYTGEVYVVRGGDWSLAAFPADPCAAGPSVHTPGTGPLVLPAIGPASGGPDERFGDGLADVGDLDGDGLADLWIGATAYPAFELGDTAGPPQTVAGHAEVWSYTGSAMAAVPGGTITSPTTASPFGAFGHAAAAVDLDDAPDGQAEIVISQPTWEQDGTRYGRALVYGWSHAGGSLSFQLLHTIEGDNPAGLFGWEVQGSGDLLPGDGLDRDMLLIGAGNDSIKRNGQLAVAGADEQISCSHPTTCCEVDCEGFEPDFAETGGHWSGSLFLIGLVPDGSGGERVIKHVRVVGEDRKDHLGGGFATGVLGDGTADGVVDLVCSGFAFPFTWPYSVPVFPEPGRIYVMPGGSYPLAGPWSDQGHSMGWPGGVPRLMVAGRLDCYTPVSGPHSQLIMVGDRMPRVTLSPALYLVAGAQALNAPFHGGVMVPSPDVFLDFSALLGDGDGRFQYTFPSSSLVGVPRIHFQFWGKYFTATDTIWFATNGVRFQP